MAKLSYSPMSLIIITWITVTLFLAHQSVADVDDKTLTQNQNDFVGASHTNALTNTRPTWNHILAVSYGYGLKSAARTTFKNPLPPNHAYFTIHGLWPNNKTAFSPPRLQKPIGELVFCSTSPLVVADVQSLRKELDVKWPDLYVYGDSVATVRFWEREWEKHGTCTPFSKIQYFKKSMELFDLLGLTSIVKSGAALAPNNTKTYTIGNVFQAFQGKQPFLVCSNTKAGGDYVLTELYFCLDNQLGGFVNCTTFYSDTHNNNCQHGFKIMAN